MSHENYLVCGACHRFFHRLRNGVTIEEGRPIGPVGWGPYKLWAADLWKCEGCGAEIVAGFGLRPIAEHFQPTYEATRERLRPLFRVDDCPGGPYRAPAVEGEAPPDEWAVRALREKRPTQCRMLACEASGTMRLRNGLGVVLCDSHA